MDEERPNKVEEPETGIDTTSDAQAEILQEPQAHQPTEPHQPLESGSAQSNEIASTKKTLRRIGVICVLVSLPSFLIMTTCDSLWNKITVVGPVASIEFFILALIYKNQNKTLRYIGWFAFGSGALFILYVLSMPTCGL